MIRLVKRNREGKVIAQCVLDIPRRITIEKVGPAGEPVLEEVKHPSLTASLADGWKENYTDMLEPIVEKSVKIDFDALKAEYATATTDRKIEIIATLLRLV